MTTHTSKNLSVKSKCEVDLDVGKEDGMFYYDEDVP